MDGCLLFFHVKTTERILMKFYSVIAYTPELHIGYNLIAGEAAGGC